MSAQQTAKLKSDVSKERYVEQSHDVTAVSLALSTDVTVTSPTFVTSTLSTYLTVASPTAVTMALPTNVTVDSPTVATLMLLTDVTMKPPTDVTVAWPTAVTMASPTSANMVLHTAASMALPTAVTMASPTSVTMASPTAVTMASPAAVTMASSTSATMALHTSASMALPTAASMALPTSATMASPTAVTMASPTAVTMASPTTVTMASPTAASMASATMASPTAVSMASTTAVSMASPTAVTMASPTAVSMASPTAVSMASHTAVSMASPTAVSMASPTAVSIASPTAVSMETPTGATMASPIVVSMASPTTVYMATSTGATMASPTAVSMATSTGATMASPTAVTMALQSNDVPPGIQDMVPVRHFGGTNAEIATALGQSGRMVNVNMFNIQQASITSEHTQIGSSENTQIGSSKNTQIGSHNCISPDRTTEGSDYSDKLKKLLDKTLMEINQWKQVDGKVFVETPALKESRLKLDSNGCVTILGLSGDGKTSVGYSLLDSSGRQVVIIREPSDWEEIDTEKEQVIMIDDIMGRHVYEKKAKTNWVKKFKSIYSSVKSLKVQVVITSRTTVFSVCEKELQFYDLFHPNNIVHLSGSESRSKLDTDTKIEILHKYIYSDFAKPKISICKANVEILTGVQRKISVSTVKMIAKKETVLGFPQCCRTFVSIPSCFARGHTFFDNPTEFLINEIDRMRMSRNVTDANDYCTLACVTIFGELTVDNIESLSKPIKEVAEACEISITPISLKKAATHLSTSYLVYSQSTCRYTFQHNSLIETVFSSFFKVSPQLLIEHCEFDLIQSLVTTEHAKEESGLFCRIQGTSQTNCLCSWLETEIMASRIERVVEHRVLTDDVFAGKFCSYIEASCNKTTILQSTERDWFGHDESILYWAAAKSNECFMKCLLIVMEPATPAAAMKKELSKALLQACKCGSYGVYKLLVSRPGVAVDGKCLSAAACGGNCRIVDELLSVREWHKCDVAGTLHQACMHGNYEVYKSLVLHDVTVLDDECLWMAAKGGNSRIIEHLLSDREWDRDQLTDALSSACRYGKYDTYRSLVAHDDTVLGGHFLMAATVGGNTQIKDDLRSKGYTL